MNERLATIFTGRSFERPERNRGGAGDDPPGGCKGGASHLIAPRREIRALLGAGGQRPSPKALGTLLLERWQLDRLRLQQLLSHPLLL